MIEIKSLEDNMLQATATGKIDAGDFSSIISRIDNIIKENGSIRLLLDGSDFDGWESTDAMKEHLSFVKDHQSKVEKIALLAGHEWQHWLAHGVGLFVHPEIKVFDKDAMLEAKVWLAD